MIKKPVVGISGCLAGSSVRFDGGHKRASFLMDKLLEWVTFKPVCPEMAIGLPVPWICPYISRHLLSLNPSLAHCRRYSRG
ncbi:2-thiouracil desulfurase family protein, partial [Escherichia coli]|uniref:2-thiouracil desulfurase family protein n=1 Tax=Escherichia coli TaxID=562 RepID=UPI002021783A